MTKMDAELLRRACEVAGIKYYREEDYPALPAYAASLLVAKVRGRKKIWQDYYQQLNIIQNKETPYITDYLATNEQRISAALKALETAGEGGAEC